MGACDMWEVRKSSTDRRDLLPTSVFAVPTTRMKVGNSVPVALVGGNLLVNCLLGARLGVRIQRGGGRGDVGRGRCIW